jgi:hypothetical protein
VRGRATIGSGSGFGDRARFAASQARNLAGVLDRVAGVVGVRE